MSIARFDQVRSMHPLPSSPLRGALRGLPLSSLPLYKQPNARASFTVGRSLGTMHGCTVIAPLATSLIEELMEHLRFGQHTPNLRLRHRGAPRIQVGCSTGRSLPVLVTFARGSRKSSGMPRSVGQLAGTSLWRLRVQSAAPNPSVKARPNGKPPGPGRRYAVHFRRPGPGVLPSVPPYLER